MKNFWLNFIIAESISVVAAFLASNTTIKPETKKALEDFITAGHNLVTALQHGA